MPSVIQISSLLLLLLISWFCSCEALEKPDCTRMVFHPRCRGISAKRSSNLPLFEEADKQYNLDDSFETPYNWKNEIDSDLVERIIREVFFGNRKMKSHGHSYYDEEK